MFGRGDRVTERRVHHDDAFGGRRCEVDIVDPDAGATDHLETLGLVEDLGRDLGRGAHREAVELADVLCQLILVAAELGLKVDLDAAILEDLDSGGGQCVRDQNLGNHGHHAAFDKASLLLAKAQSSHSVSASTSAVSTVEPHQIRNPGGASR